MWIAILFAVLIAALVCLILYRQMKSVAEKQDAQDYISGGLHLTRQSDIYTHTTRTRIKVEDHDHK